MHEHDAGADEPVPEGFAPHERRSPLTDPWAPLYSRRVGETLQIGVRVREAHCNGRGFAHGGLISALADNAMGLSAVMTVRAAGFDDGARAVTVNLALDFIDSGRVGEWLEVLPSVLKAGRTLAFVECHVRCDGRLVARGSATFRMV